MHNNLDVFKFGQIGRQTTELAALEHPKIPQWVIKGNMVSTGFLGCLLTVQNILITAGSRVSDRCPFCYLFFLAIGSKFWI